MSDLERQIIWVTRASSDHDATERRADYAQLLRQVPQVSQLSLLNAQGREQLRHDAPDRHARQQRRFLPRRQADRDRLARHQLCAGLFRGERPFMSIALSHADGSITIAEIDLGFLVGVSSIDAQVGKVALRLCHRSPRGEVLASSVERAGGRQESVRRCRRSRPSCKPGGMALASGTDIERQRAC